MQTNRAAISGILAKHDKIIKADSGLWLLQESNLVFEFYTYSEALEFAIDWIYDVEFRRGVKMGDNKLFELVGTDDLITYVNNKLKRFNDGTIPDGDYDAQLKLTETMINELKRRGVEGFDISIFERGKSG